MRLHLPIPPTSPLPHRDDAPPLLRSPTSVLSLTASEQRRRRKLVRELSSEPTIAGGLANWRRQPMKLGSGTGTATTDSVGMSETKKGRRGVGMGMQGTPAKKGKRSNSRSMGVHSTPAINIRSRTQSLSHAQGNTAGATATAGSSLSSLDSSLPSSADFDTPSPHSQIPDLSSPSVPAIAGPTLSRKWDVFDGAYVPSPKNRTSAEIEDFDRLVQDAEQDQTEQIPSEEGEGMEDGMGDGLFGWQEDVLWSLQGSTESASGHDVEADEEGGVAEGTTDPTIRDGTVYHDMVVSMNDNTDRSTSPSSRTKRRSNTIQSRQPTPRRPRTGSSSDQAAVRRKRAAVHAHTLGSSSSSEETTFYTARTSRASPALERDEGSSANEDIAELPPFAREAGASPRKSGPHPLTPSPTETGERRPQTKASESTRPTAVSTADAKRPPPPPDRSLLSQLLDSTNPVPSGLTLSQLLKSTQSTGGTQLSPPEANDEPVEIGRGRATPPLEFGDDLGQQRSDSPAAPLPDFGEVDSVQMDAGIDHMDGYDAFDDAPMYEWKLGHGSGLPTPFTPSSHLSPRSVQSSLSPISFATTRSPSVQLRITPPPSPRPALQETSAKMVRKGAWKGAEVLARMEDASRGTAKYHAAFDPALLGKDVEEEDELVKNARKKRGSMIASVYEESEEVLEARRRRIAHYQELEERYELHVELVF